jgi:SAM-dependent methyltransferase
VTAPPVFKDHFSGQSDAYQKYRPDYPPALFEWLASQAPARRLAIDVATGNGQAAVALAPYFDRVIATEPSSAAAGGSRASWREYRQGGGGRVELAADLLTAAQAAHWFDWPRFCVEGARVLRPGGVLAVWSYGYGRVEPVIDGLIADFSRDVVGPYWPRERRHVEEAYRDLVLPFPLIDAPDLEMQTHWDAGAMLNYLDTWSAVRRCRARTGRDPLRLLAEPLRQSWGDGTRDMRWPLTLRAGRA